MDPSDGYFQSQKRKLHISRQPREQVQEQGVRQARSTQNTVDLRRQMEEEEVEYLEGKQAKQQLPQQEQVIPSFQNNNHNHNRNQANVSSSYYEASNSTNQDSNNTTKSTTSSTSSGNSTVNFMYASNYNNRKINMSRTIISRDRIITSNTCATANIEQDEEKDNLKENQITVEEAIYLFRIGKITFQEQTPENEYIYQKMQFLQHMISCGILASLSLSKLAVDGVFETYLQLQKLSSPSKRKSHSSRLFSLHSPVVAHLKDMTFKYIKELVRDALEQAESNMQNVLKYRAKMEQFAEGIEEGKGKDKLEGGKKQLNNVDNNAKSPMEIEIIQDSKFYLTECTLLSQQFETFLGEQFLPLKTKLFSEIEMDNVIFEDPLKQDEIGYIIKFPEEFIAHKFNDYLKINVSQSQQQNIELLSNLIGFLAAEDDYQKSVLYDKITAKIGNESAQKQQKDKGQQQKLRMP